MGVEVTAAVSLLLSAPGREGQVLLAVRSATPTSRRHPDVLSTPTMRIPTGVLDAVLAEHLDAPPSLAQGQIEPLPGLERVEFGGAQTLASGISFLVEALFARKLGAAELLLEGRLHGHAALAALAVDLVPDAATEEEELTHMLTIAVELDQGASLLPAQTLSYSQFVWAPLEKLEGALADSDPLRLASDLDLNVCIQGLCVRSAAALHPSSAV